MSATTRPWLSVIFPVHNGELWVAAALDSLALEADPGIEIVVIDTSDSMGTRAIIDQYASRLNLRFLDPDGASGCTQKTNHGARNASADHVSWLCQDDLWLAGRTAAVRQWIAQDPGAVLHLAPSAIVDRNGRELGQWRCPLQEPVSGAPLDRTALLERLLVQNFVAVVSPVVRRDAWLAVGGIDPDLWYTGDWDLWIKLARHGAVRFHDQVTGAFRIHDQSATSLGSTDRNEFIAQHRIVVDRYVAELPPSRSGPVRAMAEASLQINAALAAAAQGSVAQLMQALWTALQLGPVGLTRYLNYSRVIDRSLPRLRAKFAGAL